jgi:hypothetical protein
MENNTKKILGWSAGLIVAYIIYLKYKASKAASIVPTMQGNNAITQGMNFGNMADNIFNALDGYGYSMQPIVDVFAKLNTTGDFNALSQSYGTRTLNSGFLNIFQSNYTGDLVGSLKNQLSASDLSTLNQLLTAKGIPNIT